jgi:hypothetical protein
MVQIAQVIIARYSRLVKRRIPGTLAVNKVEAGRDRFTDAGQ